MIRSYPTPPQGGACQGLNPRWFADAETEQEQQAGKAICWTCPIFRQCQQYAQKMVEEENREVNPQCGTRIPLAGIVAGEHYVPTDYRGVPIRIEKILQEME